MEKTETATETNEHTNVAVQQARFKRDLTALCDRAQSYMLTRVTKRHAPKVGDLLDVLSSFSFYVDRIEALTLMGIVLGREENTTIPPTLVERLEISEEADRLKLVFADLMGVQLNDMGVPMWHLYSAQLENTLNWWK